MKQLITQSVAVPTLNSHSTERYDLVASYIHWSLADLSGFCGHEQRWKHVPEKVLNNSDWKILWDYTIHTGSSLPHNRPYITLVEVYCYSWRQVRISQKSVEKRDRYV